VEDDVGEDFDRRRVCVRNDGVGDLARGLGRLRWRWRRRLRKTGRRSEKRE